MSKKLSKARDLIAEEYVRLANINELDSAFKLGKTLIHLDSVINKQKENK